MAWKAAQEDYDGDSVPAHLLPQIAIKKLTKRIDFSIFKK
jgi:hypothetical protein